MGKKAKEHRKKVEKRNKVISQQKSAMQKAFDMLMKQQIENFKKNEGMDVSLSGQPLTFSVVDQDEQLNVENTEIDVETITVEDFVEIKEENKEEEK
jgi:hypothetical protein